MLLKIQHGGEMPSGKYKKIMMSLKSFASILAEL